MYWALSRSHRLVGLTLRRFAGWGSGGCAGEAKCRELDATHVVGPLNVGIVEFTVLGLVRQ